MSLQWTFVATFLYTEVFMVILLLLPFISPSRWQKIFRSRLLNAISAYANIYFNIFIVVLVLLFIDSIRDVKRYTDADSTGNDLRNNPNAEAIMHMKLFRAQRNFYIAGMALFLFLVLRRLITLLSQTATLEANIEASMKQAKSATEMAENLMKEQATSKKDKDAESDEASTDSAKKIEQLTKQLEKSQNDLKRTALDLDTMRKQSKGTNAEYDRLLSEHENLQIRLKEVEGDTGNKKDE